VRTPTTATSGEARLPLPGEALTRRAVTVITAAIVIMTFAFSLGNVTSCAWTSASPRGSPGWSLRLSISVSSGCSRGSSAGAPARGGRRAEARRPRGAAACALGELTYAEAAETLGCSVNAVGIRVHKVKARLRKLLGTETGAGRPFPVVIKPNGVTDGS
jgi:hypothetical protein